MFLQHPHKTAATLLTAGVIAAVLCLATGAFAQEDDMSAATATTGGVQKLLPGGSPTPDGKAVIKPIVPPELPPEPQKPMQMEDMNTVQLRTIDKLSARTHTFDIPVNKTVKFGNSLFIKVRACRKSSPLDQPENAAFLQIWEHKQADEEAHWVFSGWMFSSSPSLSAMDHPVYDVWVIDCKNAKTSVKEAAEFSSEQAPGTVPPPAAPAADAPKPATDTPATDAPKPPDTKPASPAPDAPKPPSGTAPGAVPLDQLPGSFDDDSGTDNAAPTPDGTAPGTPGD